MLCEEPDAYDADLVAAQTQPLRYWDAWVSGAEDEPRATWLALVDGEAVGMVAATLRADQCEVGALWVESEWRGSRTGRLLMEAAELWAHKMDAVQLSLSVAEDNAVASRLYLSLHYTHSGSSKVTSRGNQELYMHKRVGV
jgi:GNAT superfamily N-acetyltransferase